MERLLTGTTPARKRMTSISAEIMPDSAIVLFFIRSGMNPQEKRICTAPQPPGHMMPGQTPVPQTLIAATTGLTSEDESW